HAGSASAASRALVNAHIPDMDKRRPMTQSPLGHTRNPRLLAGAVVFVPPAILVGTSGTASAAPCDIYAAGGTPCVAAHSTTRALFDAYNGPLYQVQRASDNTTLNIGVLSAGGYANAAAQDTFCAGTTCVITEIYDQSKH